MTLNQPTPKHNTLLWQLGTFFYALVIFINQNFELISMMGFSTAVENQIKFYGAFAYFLFTYYQFSQSTFDQKNKKK
jgi:hypothetical protein